MCAEQKEQDQEQYPGVHRRIRGNDQNHNHGQRRFALFRSCTIQRTEVLFPELQTALRQLNKIGCTPRLLFNLVPITVQFPFHIFQCVLFVYGLIQFPSQFQYL